MRAICRPQCQPLQALAFAGRTTECCSYNLSGGTIRHASPCIQRAPEVQRPAPRPAGLHALTALTVAGLHRALSLASALSRVMPCAWDDTGLQLSTSAGASGRQLLRATVMHTFRRKRGGCNRRMPPSKSDESGPNSFRIKHTFRCRLPCFLPYRLLTTLTAAAVHCVTMQL